MGKGLLSLFVVSIWVLTPCITLGKSLSDFKKPSQEVLKKKLTAEQYQCTQEQGTEKPFQNAYWDNHEAGIYVDVVSGEPLFSSLDKYDSGSGWPSFTKPLVKENLVAKKDKSIGVRTEIRSRHANSHLGHVFDDGPGPTGLRYCMNSAALRFIPKEKLVEEGYGEFLPLFKGKSLEIATVAGGCFWCVEPTFSDLPGVTEVISGYTGGVKAHPTYEEVSSGATGHAESVQITFDPSKIHYDQILDVFWKNIDPTDPDGQFVDRGRQYRTVIFYHTPEQKRLAEKSKEKLEKSGKFRKKIVTEIIPVSSFYPAEDHHQHFCKKNPDGYHRYREGSGRDKFLERVWGKEQQKAPTIQPR